MLRSPTHHPMSGGHGPASLATTSSTTPTATIINTNSKNISTATTTTTKTTTTSVANSTILNGAGASGISSSTAHNLIDCGNINIMANGSNNNNNNHNNKNNNNNSNENVTLQNSVTTTAATSSTTTTTTRTSLFDSCHRKIRLIGGGPVAFLGGLVAKARRKERDGDQSTTDTKLYLEESVLERKLPDADLKTLVDLPAGLDYNEWLASHTLALFEHVNLVYGTISEFCTTSGCPDMTGPGNRTYLWFDEKGKKTRVAAPQYIDYVMTFTQKTVSDESIFPTKYANEFPSSFESIARKILRLQFHVIAHLYAAHFREIALLGLHTHLNLTFAHLTALHRRFNLIDEKETDVLRDLEVALRLTDDVSSSILQGNNTGSGGGNSSSGISGNGGGGGGGGGDTISTTSGVGCSLSEETSLIDGDASIQPICTQPEAMRVLSDQSDIRGGAGGGGDGGFCGKTNALCSSNSIAGGINGSHHIGGTMNFNNNNSSSYNSSTHPNTSSSPLQCNSNNSSNSNNSHTTTTA